jgi:hypothetical protein
VTMARTRSASDGVTRAYVAKMRPMTSAPCGELWDQREWLRVLVSASVVASAVVLAWHLVHNGYFARDYFIMDSDVI